MRCVCVGEGVTLANAKELDPLSADTLGGPSMALLSLFFYLAPSSDSSSGAHTTSSWGSGMLYS